jgi:hypothetical protein
LIARDGRKYPIERQRAIKDSVVAEYRSAVKMINAFLSNPSQQKLDVSYTYVAGLSENLKSIFYLLFGMGTLAKGLAIWTRRRYIFEHERVTLLVSRPFRHVKQEFATQRISAIIDRQVANRRRIELRLDGQNEIPVVSVGERDASKLDRIPSVLAELLGKPVERVSG